MQTIKSRSALPHDFSIAALTLAMLSAPALAQNVDRPNVKVGDRWLFEVRQLPGEVKMLDRTWVITSVTPTSIEGTDSGRKLVLTPDLNHVESRGVKFSDLRLLSFPLEIGKKWSFSSVSAYPSGTFNDYGCSAAVVSYEKVRVPAGEFDAFKLEAKCNFRAVGETAGDPGESTWKYWYAPAARAIVYYEYTNSRMGTTSIRRLSEFQLQP